MMLWKQDLRNQKNYTGAIMNVRRLNELISHKESLKKLLEDKIAYALRACPHGVKHAYNFISFCEKCSYDYIKYCITNGIEVPQRKIYLEILPTVQAEVAKIEEAKTRKEAKERLIHEAKEAEITEANERRRKREEEFNKIKKKYGIELAKYISERYQSSEELGKRYERFVGYLYEMLGYRVEFNGIKKGKEDGGIDLIAKAKSHIVIIQCKRRGQNSQIHENTINQLVGTLLTYQKENQGKQIECVLYTQNDNLDDAARKTLKLHNDDIAHIVEPYPFDVGKSYPLIKCNVGNNNEKIYHLPTDAMYDRIKIEKNKSECYVDTEEEAINLGFRRAK